MTQGSAVTQGARRLPVVQSSNSNSNSNSDSNLEPAIDLADLNEAHLDWEGLDCVLADLDDFAEVIQIQARSASGDELTASDLVRAREGLVDGEFAAVQIVYRFAGQVWCDTLLREPAGAQLLRMLQPLRATDPVGSGAAEPASPAPISPAQ